MKSEIGNIDWFPFGERICSYSGLVPSMHVSGKTIGIEGSLSREAVAALGNC